ncbi:MAG: hypothetical protein IPK13_27755 [Deltaproteobacteria bacterium]|nr:hypothetical protein [Deltaproteobacteria bacterium]
MLERLERSLDAGQSALMRGRQEIRDALEWYASIVRPLVERHLSADLEEMDEQADRLSELLAEPDPRVRIPILGEAAVGKSTLINALVADHIPIVPQGGVGPHTAQATHVEFSETRYFEVEYHRPKQLNQLRLILEARLSRGLARPLGEPAVSARDADSASSEDIGEPQPTADLEVDDLTTLSEELQGAYKQQAALVLCGNPRSDVTLEYLCDGLRRCLPTSSPKWGTDPSPEDAERIRTIKSLFSREDATRRVSASGDSDDCGFFEELEMHASGYLAPLVKKLSIGWNAPFLRGGVQLIDLPGLGVANDSYRAVTAENIRNARAILLVVNRSGVSENSADLLRSSGFINSLLHEDPEQHSLSVELVVAVTQLDLPAADERKKAKQRRGGGGRDFVACLDDICERAKKLAVEQLKTELLKLHESGGDSARAARHEAIQRALTNISIHPVSSIEHQKLFEGDPDDRARIQTASESRIPGLRQHLAAVAERTLDHHARRLEASARRFREACVMALREAEGLVDSSESSVEDIMDNLRDFSEPRRQELDNRRGQLREFLRYTLPAELSLSVQQASDGARRDLQKYLGDLRGCHWATLRAAIRRGGSFRGSRTIDLPNELTLRFEEPVAVAWSQTTLLRFANAVGR